MLIAAFAGTPSNLFRSAYYYFYFLVRTSIHSGALEIVWIVEPMLNLIQQCTLLLCPAVDLLVFPLSEVTDDNPPFAIPELELYILKRKCQGR